MKSNKPHFLHSFVSRVFYVLLLVSASTSTFAGGLHLSGSIGYLGTEQNGIENEHGNFAGTVTVGVEVLGLLLGTVYAEYERTLLLGEGELDNEDYDYTSDGIYLALRTAGPLYLIGRAGFVKATFDPEIRRNASSRDEAISVGVGYGFGLRNELLYTRIEHDSGGSTDLISFVIGF